MNGEIVSLSNVLYIVMPAYNEEENIRGVIQEWYPKLSLGDEGSKLIVADSGSTDSTHRILVELQDEYPDLVILPDTLKQHGPKLIAMYRYAIMAGADYIFQTDSDGQTDPAEFDRFWKLRTRYEAVLGYRAVRGDGRMRKRVEQIVCMLLKLYFGVGVPDSNAPFRLMKASLLERYVSRFTEDYNLPNIMLTTFFAYYHEQIIFRKVTFKERTAGSSSINLKKLIVIGVKALSDFREFKRGM